LKPNLSFKKQIIEHIEENISLKQTILESYIDPIDKCVHYFLRSLKNDGKIIFCGNGGSAADSQHLAAELVVRLRGIFDRPSIPAIALTVNSSILTAAGNDYGFNKIFSRQIEAVGNPNDILVAISTSGNSLNIIEAVKSARDKKMFIIGFLGEDGGKLKSLVDLPVLIPSNITARIQEAHIMIGHIICQIVETELYQQK
jgi:D-sedoheptulose 7-phosphate isomerase